MKYERARSLCAFHGGGLAEIPTEDVYVAVYDHVKTNWYFTLNDVTETVLYIWLGSSYDVSWISDSIFKSYFNPASFSVHFV